MIAGLEDVSSGSVEINGRNVNDIAPSKRQVSMVFQTYALYPHLSVYANMAFGLKQAKTAKEEIDRRVKEAAEALQIQDLLDRRPRNLSGGQRQRVAIGRAIVRDPEIFLFDEPLSNLDAALRVQTRLEIARLHRRLESTMIYVTHDQVEAMTLADRIVVLRDGHIEQVGTPIELYDFPANAFVARFIGSPKMNFFGADSLTKPPPLVSESAATLGIRPEHLQLASGEGALVEGRLELVEELGEYVLVHLIGESGNDFVAKLDSKPSAAPGERLGFVADPHRMHFFDHDSGRRLASQVEPEEHAIFDERRAPAPARIGAGSKNP
eukprot:XP_011407057.1 PREDICTED: uncharacterized protein LOC105314531 [Amphimedon queenslandica]